LCTARRLLVEASESGRAKATTTAFLARTSPRAFAMDGESPPSGLPRVRTRAGDRAIRRRASDQARGLHFFDVQPGAAETLATPTRDHPAVSSAPPSSNVTTRGSSAASLSSLDDVVDASPGATPTRSHRAWVLVSHLRETLRHTTLGTLLRRKAAAPRAAPPPLSRESEDADGRLSHGHGGPPRSSREPSSLAARADVPREDVLTLRYDQPVGEALRQLASRNVLSAPVIDFAEGVRYEGFLSVGDIVLDLVQRDTAEKHLLLHQLGEAARGYATRRTSSTTTFDPLTFRPPPPRRPPPAGTTRRRAPRWRSARRSGRSFPCPR
jgi:CBS domain-containing protein